MIMSSPTKMLVAKDRPQAAGLEVAVRIQGVVKHFGEGEQRVMALRGVDWEVYKGQMSLLVGPSGCGKTTLLSVIAGILDCDSGSVDAFGSTITRLTDGQKTRFRAQH